MPKDDKRRNAPRKKTSKKAGKTQEGSEEME